MNFEKHKIISDDIDGIVICGENPTKCIVSFSSMNKGKYERWSWFDELNARGSQDLYIILKDDTQHYYIGDDNNAINLRYYRFFEVIFEKYKIERSNVFMMGSSMGGFAAIYYGFWLEAKGIIAINPQTTYAASRLHNLQIWERMIRETGNHWVDLDQFIYRFQHKPIIYLEHSDYAADVAAANSLVNALTDLRITHFRSYVGGVHGGTSLTKEKLTKFIDLSFEL